MPEIVLYTINDDLIELHIDGKYVMSANHDSDGRAGMEKFTDVVKIMALFTGNQVEEIEVGG